MKKNKLLIIAVAIIIMTMPGMAKAQSDYRQAVKEYCENDKKISKALEQLSSEYIKTNTWINQLILVDKTDAEAVANKYVKEQLVDDIYDILLIPTLSKKHKY